MHWEKLKQLFSVLPFMTNFHEPLPFQILRLALAMAVSRKSCVPVQCSSHNAPPFLIKPLDSLFQACAKAPSWFYAFCVFRMFFLFSFTTCKFYIYFKTFSYFYRPHWFLFLLNSGRSSRQRVNMYNSRYLPVLLSLFCTFFPMWS